MGATNRLPVASRNRYDNHNFNLEIEGALSVACGRPLTIGKMDESKGKLEKLGAKPKQFPKLLRYPIPYVRRFSDLEVESLKIGLCPQRMEDHWGSIFRNSGFEVYRSWTGIQCYRLRLFPDKQGARVYWVWVSLEPRSVLTVIFIPFRLFLFPLHIFLVGMLIHCVFSEHESC